MHILEEEYKKILNGKHDYIEEILSKQMFTGLDIEEDCIKKAKLNMFLLEMVIQLCLEQIL
ncbi:hypothetical protein F1Z41_00900 [Clostridium perfringens]|nr:hypothetical protein [Clostridium perfringens]